MAEQIKVFNCLITGVGGQGTVLASKLIALTAIKKGFKVRTTETIGMAQRGGSVVSHVRIGEDVFSPIIPSAAADLMIAFEPSEAARHLVYLSEQGFLIICDNAIPPSGAGLISGTAEYNPDDVIKYLQKVIKKLSVISCKKLDLRNPKTLNVALLGAAAESGIFPFDKEAIMETIPEILPEKFRDINLEAYKKGREVFRGKN